MPDGIQQLNEDIIAAARILSREGLVQGFGHVSARIPDSDLFVITPRVSLELVEANQLVVLNLQGQVLEAPVSPSFETALHTAIFNARPEVNAITRIHARTANMFSVTDTPLEAVHNHGSFFSGGVPVHRTIDLISTRELGEGAAAAPGDAAAVLLQGNGQVTVGRTIPEAVMMAIYLEEAAQILYGAMQVGTPRFLPGEAAGSRQKEALPPPDMERAWNFFKSRVGM
jgi:L-ribulose-5-phosphate 4-epimerase